MSIFFLGLFIVLVSYFQIKKLYQRKQMREIYVFSASMAIATYLSLGSILKFHIPNPIQGLELIFQPMQDWINQLLS